MTRDLSQEALIETDWSDAWESLPPAPPLVPRPKTTQLTLRMPERLVRRLKQVAAAKSLPYHSLARAWIAQGVANSNPMAGTTRSDEPQAAQLNLKVDQVLLDAIKSKAGEIRRPYHALARDLIEAAVEREEADLGIAQLRRRGTSSRTTSNELRRSRATEK